MNSDNVEHHPQNNVVYKKKILAVLATTFGRKDKFYAATWIIFTTDSKINKMSSAMR